MNVVGDTGESPRSPAVIRVWTKDRIVTVALLAATAIVGYVCYLLIVPFLPALAWALALAVMAHPMHRWIRDRIGSPTVAAGLSVIIVTFVVVGPAAFVTQNLVQEAASATGRIQRAVSNGTWREVLEKNATLKSAADWWSRHSREWLKRDDDVPDSKRESEAVPARPAGTGSPISTERAADIVTQGVGTVLTGSASILFQLFMTLMILFFFFRDRHLVLEGLRSLLPISANEIDDVFARINDTIHATVYGSILVGIVQGGMGGLIFWWLGLPSPLLWGAIMALLAIVPVLGTFVIWGPTAIWLAISGEWSKAILLTAWGGIAIGLIDNFLYPYLVGRRMRFHTLLVFFAIVGGIAVFGACGVILGPLVLAVADALIEIWRRRLAALITIDRGIG